MACDKRRRLIVNADDFGASSEINQAVWRAHDRGILTSASLMVGGEACEEAVAIARACPRLAVGLHLTLVLGRAVLPANCLPGLVRADGTFIDDPRRAGWEYFKHRALRLPLRQEIAAQLEKFHSTGLPLNHLNGHLHLHMHPVVLDMVLELTDDTVPLRVTRDWFFLNARVAQGRWVDRALHAMLFHILGRRTASLLRGTCRRHTSAVFGLLQNGRVDDSFITRLIPHLPYGDSELYSHPSLVKARRELDALVAPRVRKLIDDHDIELIHYGDL